jgi:hypothetical protein
MAKGRNRRRKIQLLSGDHHMVAPRMTEVAMSRWMRVLATVLLTGAALPVSVLAAYRFQAHVGHVLIPVLLWLALAAPLAVVATDGEAADAQGPG